MHVSFFSHSEVMITRYYFWQKPLLLDIIMRTKEGGFFNLDINGINALWLWACQGAGVHSLVCMLHARTTRNVFVVPGSSSRSMHTPRKKVLHSTFFWCFRLSQIEHSIQYLEGPNSTWKDHDRSLGVQMEILIMVLSDIIWSFQVMNRVLYLWQPNAPKTGVLKYFFFRV